jgi:hypothetical protein
MKPPGKKQEPKLGLDMSFGELLGRAIQTDPKEVERSIEKSKTKKPPGSKEPSGGKREGKNVVELRQRRNRKRNHGR